MLWQESRRLLLEKVWTWSTIPLERIHTRWLHCSFFQSLVGKISGGNQVLGGSVETKFQSVKYKTCGPDELPTSPAHFDEQPPALHSKHFAGNTLFYGLYAQKPCRVFFSTPLPGSVLLACSPPKLKPCRARVLHEATAPQQLQSSTRNTLLLKIVGQHGDDGWPEGLGTATVATPAVASVPLSSRLMPPQYWFATRFASWVASSS